MYARVIVAQLLPLQPQSAGVLPPSVLVELKAWTGFEDVLVLLDPERNGVKLIFLWTNKAALEAYEASPAYQRHREAMERSFSGPAVYEAYEAPFHLKKVSGAVYSLLTTQQLEQLPQGIEISSGRLPGAESLRQGGYFSYAPFRQDRSQEPRPQAEELVRVIPIVQKRTQDETTVELLSLESYTDGFILHTRLWVAHPAHKTAAQLRQPQIRQMIASDDRGTPYQGFPQGGGGKASSWRFTFGFVPALTESARELRLTLPELRWLPFKQGAPEVPRADEEIQTGPWMFTIALPESA